MSQHPFLNDISARIQNLLARVRPPAKDRGLLVALSGGPDSVALLLAAVHWSRTARQPLAAAHLNHQLRGTAADRDADFCRDLCAGAEVPLFEQREDPRPLARQRGLGLEEAGRHLRRRFFLALLKEHPEFGAVATGHHLDDQAETVIMRLFRGTGLDGLRGIRPVQESFVRPLLEVTRRDILAFLEAHGQTYRTDETNLVGDNVRSRLRRELLPLARDIFGPGCGLAPARLAGLVDPDLQLLENLADRAWADLAAGEDGTGLSVNGLLELEGALARRVLKKWLTGRVDAEPTEAPDLEVCLELVHIENILAWLRQGQSGSGLDLPGNRRLIREFDLLRLEPDGPQGLPLRLAADYRILVRPAAEDTGDLDAEAVDRSSGTDGWELTCPADALQGNLQVRNWRPGDRLRPLGLGGSKKLSDLFREMRVPAGLRDRILIVSDDQGILWAVGVARDERTRLLPSTGQAITIRVVRRGACTP